MSNKSKALCYALFSVALLTGLAWVCVTKRMGEELRAPLVVSLGLLALGSSVQFSDHYTSDP